ncbi:uncharacterized protein LOC128273838 isoform X2 [Anopheles cruzii]|uniref:uncharacterized protein LOC128273838 isoform X2 n=1 Tax=Anopheles cruzii TaxID=68878 RepID=UPI0022EC2567|nr:uncharacterized protein LOC128273838 isoform X2 [Anopheles cruzii]
MSRALSLSATVLLAVVVPLVIGAPTHLPDLWYGQNTPAHPEDPSGTSSPPPTTTGRPHSVEPTWITVTMNPVEARYDPPGGSIQPPTTMQPYVAYVPVPPVPPNHAAPGWPRYFPGMPVLPPPPYPYSYHHLCGQHANQAYRLL